MASAAAGMPIKSGAGVRIKHAPLRSVFSFVHIVPIAQMKRADRRDGVGQVERLQIRSCADLNSSPSKSFLGRNAERTQRPTSGANDGAFVFHAALSPGPPQKRPTKRNYTLIVSISHFLSTLAGEICFLIWYRCFFSFFFCCCSVLLGLRSAVIPNLQQPRRLIEKDPQ